MRQKLRKRVFVGLLLVLPGACLYGVVWLGFPRYTSEAYLEIVFPGGCGDLSEAGQIRQLDRVRNFASEVAKTITSDDVLRQSLDDNELRRSSWCPSTEPGRRLIELRASVHAAQVKDYNYVRVSAVACLPDDAYAMATAVVSAYLARRQAPQDTAVDDSTSKRELLDSLEKTTAETEHQIRELDELRHTYADTSGLRLLAGVDRTDCDPPPEISQLDQKVFDLDQRIAAITKVSGDPSEVALDLISRRATAKAELEALRHARLIRQFYENKQLIELAHSNASASLKRAYERLADLQADLANCVPNQVGLAVAAERPQRRSFPRPYMLVLAMLLPVGFAKSVHVVFRVVRRARTLRRIT